MANKIYVNPETALVCTDPINTQDIDITLANLAAGAGRVSDQYDRGVGAKANRIRWQAVFQFATAPVVGETVDLYLATAQETAADVDGGQGQSDAALGSSDELTNMIPMGQLVVTSTDASHDMIASGLVECDARYISLVVYNNTADNLRNFPDNKVTLTPAPYEVQ